MDVSMRAQHQKLTDGAVIVNAPGLGRFRYIFQKTQLLRRRAAARHLKLSCDSPYGSMMLG